MSRKQVTCRDCGFLAEKKWASRKKIKTCGDPPTKELTFQDRRQIAAGNYYEPLTILFCMKNIWSDDDPTLTMLDLPRLNSVRECSHFVKHIPGHLPDKHLELQRDEQKEQRVHKRWKIGIIIFIIVTFAAAIITSVC